MPAQGEGQVKSQQGTQSSDDSSPPEEMGRLVGKQVHRGGGTDKQPQRQERSHGLQRGNEHQNDQGEDAEDNAGGIPMGG